MKILQVCKKFPFPVKDGEGVAVRALAQGLVEAGCTVDLLSFNTTKHWVEDPQDADLPHYRNIASCDLDNDVKPLEVGLSFFQKGSYHVHRFDNSEFAAQLKTLLQLNDYDAVILETSILALYIPTIRKNSNAVVALRAHNLEYEIWQRIGQGGNLLLRPFYGILARRLKRFERKWINEADLLLPITDRDGERFIKDLGFKGEQHTVRVGYDSMSHQKHYWAPLLSLPFAISFIGSLDWAPNLEGLKWFLEDVWPALHERFPELEFHIAGRKTPDDLLSLQLPNVTVHGEVKDSAEFLQRYPMTVAPILSGSGTRVKILDAMVSGRVVLTTEMGLEGIDAADRREVLLCPTPSAFVDQVKYVRLNPEKLDELSLSAQVFIQLNFDFARIGYGLAGKIRDTKKEMGKVLRG
jgi:glycosyltransferase involved in cell wall biosynthesis